ncbi:MAG TPA: phosphate/phosphite/phosphonate ABC transporter substrate-binding protein [Opitutales bacterium]|nr:phosphate/phosphite/phosphonate ABC transporter substrate-binding protein [Opitutales bacterium]
MRKHIFPFLPTVLILWAGCGDPTENSTSVEPDKIIVAMEPDKDPDAMLADRVALEDYMTQETGRRVEAMIPMSTAVIHEGLRNGSIDIAYLSATAAAKLIENDVVDILLAELIDGEPHYQSYWITLNEAPYQSVAELKGQPIAFSSRSSTSGFLVPVWDLYKQDLIDLETGPEGFFGEGNVYYGVGYVSAAERVLDGSAEAAAVSYYVLDQDKHLSPEQRAKLRMLDSQGPVPSHVVVVRNALNERAKTAVKEALLGMNSDAVELRDRIFGAELTPADAATHLQTTREALEISRSMRF